MSNEMYTTKQCGFTLLHLCSIVLNGTTPNEQLLSAADLHQLLRFSKRHHLEIMAYTGLKECLKHGIALSEAELGEWETSFLYAIRLSILQDHERNSLIKQLNESNMQFALLKGSAVKEYYPYPDTRQMCDFDFFFPWSRNASAKIREVMENNGYTTVSYNRWMHDTYSKPPFYTVEPHHVASSPFWYQQSAIIGTVSQQGRYRR